MALDDITSDIISEGLNTKEDLERIQQYINNLMERSKIISKVFKERYQQKKKKFKWAVYLYYGIGRLLGSIGWNRNFFIETTLAVDMAVLRTFIKLGRVYRDLDEEWLNKKSNKIASGYIGNKAASVYFTSRVLIYLSLILVKVGIYLSIRTIQAVLYLVLLFLSFRIKW